MISCEKLFKDIVLDVYYSRIELNYICIQGSLFVVYIIDI